jgi:hypothetical protein
MAKSFSAVDYLVWLKETHCSYRADLEEKLSVLDTLKYTSESLECVSALWKTEPVQYCDTYYDYSSIKCTIH